MNTFYFLKAEFPLCCLALSLPRTYRKHHDFERLSQVVYQGQSSIVSRSILRAQHLYEFGDLCVSMSISDIRKNKSQPVIVQPSMILGGNTRITPLTNQKGYVRSHLGGIFHRFCAAQALRGLGFQPCMNFYAILTKHYALIKNCMKAAIIFSWCLHLENIWVWSYKTFIVILLFWIYLCLSEL